MGNEHLPGKEKGLYKNFLSRLANEMQLKFDEAIACYEKAILYCLNDDKIKSYRTDIERVEEKKQIAKKYSNWLGKLKL